MKKNLFILIFFAVTFLISSTKAQNLSLFQFKEYKNSSNNTLLYRFLQPENLISGDTIQKYPLVIFLHGAGERGNDNKMQLMHAVKLFTLPENLKNYKCFVIAPQCPAGKRWVETDWTKDSHIMPTGISESLGLTIELTDSLIKSLPIDENRIYVTGLSMGGFGTWDLIMRFPEKFAAAVPVCGGGDETKAEYIKNIPIWAFHGGNDKLVKTIRSRNMISAIKKAGGNPKYTEYPGVGHFSWDKAYAEPDLLNWLFSQSKINKK